MSFEGGLEELKPVPKNVKADLDLLGKYENDLQYLRNGKMSIEKKLVDEGIDDETINKKLQKLDKSITKLTKMVDDYRNNIQKRIDESEEDSEEDD